jgi:hypothetical protein
MSRLVVCGCVACLADDDLETARRFVHRAMVMWNQPSMQSWRCVATMVVDEMAACVYVRACIAYRSMLSVASIVYSNSDWEQLASIVFEH